LEALEQATAHVWANFGAVGARFVAGAIIRLVGHDSHAGLGHRQRDTGRYGDKRHDHGEKAKCHEATMQRSFHHVTLTHTTGLGQESQRVAIIELLLERCLIIKKD
jgi:hypothetical protein